MDNQNNIPSEKRESYKTSKNIFASFKFAINGLIYCCLLYTSDAADDP